MANDLIQIGIDVNTNIKQATSDLDKMGGSVVNNIRTIDRLESEVNQLNKALNTGRVTEAAYSKGMQQINGELLLFQQRAAKATQVEKRFGVAAATGGKNLNRFNMTLQQGGYQLQDFIVQLQGGTSFFTAFSQQGSQFASIFGPKGAVIGAVIAIGSAIGGSLVAALGGASKGVDEFSEDLKNLNSTLDQYRDLSERIADAGTLSEEFGAAAGEIREILTALQQIQQISLKKQISELGGVGEVVRKSVMEVSETLYGLPVAFERVERLTAKQVQAAQEFLGATDGMLDAPYAVEYLKLLEEMQSSNTLEEQAAAAQKLSGFLAEHVNTRGDEIENLEQIQELQELLLNLASTSSAETARAAKEEYDAYQRNIDQRFKGEEALMQMSISATEETKKKIALSEQDKYIQDMQVVFLKAQQRIRAENGAIMEENLRLERAGYAAAAEGAKTLKNEIAANQQEMVAVFETAQELKEQLGESAYEALRLAGVDMTSGIDSAAASAARLAADLNISLAAALEMQRMASDEEAVMSQAVVKGRATDRYDVDTLLGMGYTEEYLKLIGKIKDETKELTKGLSEAEREAERLRKELEQPMVSAIDGVSNAFGDFISRGLSDFKGFVSQVLGSFQSMLAQMIATAARNKIMLSLGMGGTGLAGQAAAGQLAGIGGASAAGPIGSFIGTFGGAGAAGTGLLGGLGTGISAFSGGIGAGLGASASAAGSLLTGGASVAAGGMGVAATIGAAIPVVGAIALAIGFFSKKVKELDSGLQGTITTLDATLESFSVIQTKRFFGLSKKVRTEAEALDAEAAQPLIDAITSMQQGIMDAADVFGIASSAFDNFAYDFEVSLKGLTEEEKMQKINEELAKMGDSFASLTGHFETMNELLEAANQRMELQNRLDQLLGNNQAILTRQREAELSAMHELNRPLAQAIYDLEDAQGAVQDAFAALSASIEAEKNRLRDSFASIVEGLRERLDAANEAMSRSSSIYSMLESALSGRSVTSGLGQAFARREGALSFIRKGDFSDENKLKEALDVVAEPSEGLFGSFEDYARDFARTSTAIEEAKRLSQVQLNADEKSVLLLEEQIAKAESDLEQQLEALDQQSQIMVDQYNALLGIDTSTKSVTEAIGVLSSAIENLATARDAAKAASVAGVGSGSAGLQITGEKYQGFDLAQLRGASDLLAAANSAGVETSGKTGAQIQQAISNVTGLAVNMDNATRAKQFAMGGYHTGGLRIVGERGPELEATGPSRIYTASQTKDMLSGSRDDSELRREVSELRIDLKAALVQIAKNTRKSSDTLNKFDYQGLPESRGY